MGSPDGRREGVDPGLSDKADGIFQTGKRCVFLRNLQGIFDTDDPSQFSLDLHALPMSIFHNLPAPGDILFHRETGAIVHNRVPSCIDTGLCQFRILAVIKMNEHIDGGLLRQLPQHGTQRLSPELLHCHNGCLQDDRQAQFLRGAHHCPCREMIENIESPHCIAVAFRLLQFFEKCPSVIAHRNTPSSEPVCSFYIKKHTQNSSFVIVGQISRILK